MVATAAKARTRKRKLIGAQKPRISVIPPGQRHPQWPEVVEFVERIGVTLDKWQWLVLRASLLRQGGKWAAFTVGVCAPRQNGKDGILEVRELVGACILGEKLQIHSAHLADTSREHFRRLDEMIDSSAYLSRKVKHVWKGSGHEVVEFVNGNRIRFRTRTRTSGRGLSAADLLQRGDVHPRGLDVVDPARDLGPARPAGLVHGPAVDQTEQADGVAFARVRERALNGNHDRLAYFEWSLDVETPDEVSDEAAKDPKVWAQTNPALGIRITPEYLEAEARELDARGFAVERLGVGDWPPTDGSGTQVIPLRSGTR